MSHPSPHAAPEQIAEKADEKHQLRAEQLRLLFRFSLVGTLATLLVILLLGAILWDDLTHALFGWFVLISAVTVGRYALYKAFIRRERNVLEALRWENAFIAGVTLAGLCWMAIGTALLPDVDRMVREAHSPQPA